MNKILQLVLLVSISIAVVTAQSTNNTDQLESVADIGDELFYELIEIDSQNQATGQNEFWHVDYIPCKDLAFCMAHEDCKRYTKKECSGMPWNRKCRNKSYYKGECTNNLYYLADIVQRGKFTRMPFNMDSSLKGSLTKKDNQTVVLTLSGNVRFMGSFYLKKAFKGYKAQKPYDFDQKVLVKLVSELTKGDDGKWKAQLQSKNVDADFGNYNFDIESKYQTTTRQKMENLVSNKLIKQSLLPTQAEIENYLNQKVNSLLISM